MFWTRQQHVSKQTSINAASPTPLYLLLFFPTLSPSPNSSRILQIVGLMELPLTTAGELGRLENPGLLDDLLSSTHTASFSTWGAIILTAVASALAAAAFGILLSRLRVSTFRRRRTLVRLPSFCSSGEEEEEEDDDASISSCDTGTEDGEETDEMEERDEDDDDEEEDEEEESGDFRGAKVKGMGNFSFSSFSLADLVEGMGVVKAWDGMGLGFDGSVRAASFFDMSLGEILRSGSAAQITGASSALAWPEETDHRRGAVVRVWDGRAGDEAPAGTPRPLLGRRIAGVREGIRRR